MDGPLENGKYENKLKRVPYKKVVLKCYPQNITNEFLNEV
jgi:hypothetical protein